MRVLHLLASGGIGGIETLMKHYAQYSQNEDIFLFAFSGGVIADELAAMGKEVVHVPLRIHNNFERLKWILKCCRESRADVIVSHHSSPIFKIVLACCSVILPGVKTIAYAHANASDIYGAQYKGAALRRIVHRIGFCAADGIIAISDSVKNSLIRIFGVRPEKVFVLHNAIDISWETLPIRDFGEKLELIYVGRLIKEKGVQTILKALSYDQLRDRVHLTIVGDGAYRGELEKLTAELDISRSVDFMGLKKDISPFLSRADVFVHSPEWEEGFGITVIEAMAYGTLCICANSGALPEIIINGENGYLVEAHSVQALAEKLIWVMENAGRCESFKKIRKNAQRSVQRFDIREYARQLDEFLMKR